MAEDKNINNPVEEEDENIFTLTDEDGKELHFQFLDEEEYNGAKYLALIPLEDNKDGDYVILKYESDEEGNESLVTVDDDDEFENIADIFEDKLFSEIDYDED